MTEDMVGLQDGRSVGIARPRSPLRLKCQTARPLIRCVRESIRYFSTNKKKFYATLCSFNVRLLVEIKLFEKSLNTVSFTFFLIAVIFVKVAVVVESASDTERVLSADRHKVMLALLRHLAEVYYLKFNCTEWIKIVMKKRMNWTNNAKRR